MCILRGASDWFIHELSSYTLSEKFVEYLLN